MRMIQLAFFVILLSWVTPFSAAAGQERIKAISSEGVFEFESGRTVKLLGLELSPEAYRILPTLLAGQEIEIEEERNQETEAGLKRVYLYVKSKEIDFPFAASSSPREFKGMINAFLISTGAAKVSTTPPYKRLEEFLKLEEQARLEGEGIWSYDIPAQKSAA